MPRSAGISQPSLLLRQRCTGQRGRTRQPDLTAQVVLYRIPERVLHTLQQGIKF